MAPPTSFITISSFPFSRVVTQAEFNVANLIWFKYTATIPIILGVQTNKGGTFNPKTSVLQSDGINSVHGSYLIAGDIGLWAFLDIPGDYYIRITSNPINTPSNFDFTFTADTKSLDVISIADGDLIVNDDVDPLPAVVMNNIGAVKFYVTSIPASELGGILPSGMSFWYDPSGVHSGSNKITVVGSNLLYINSINCGNGANPVFGVDIIHDKMYVVDETRQLWTISNTGVPTNTGYVFPTTVINRPTTIAVNPTGTILYWISGYQFVGIIHVLNLSTYTALPDFYSIPGFVVPPNSDLLAITPNNHPGDMFVMSNGNVVTSWWKRSTNTHNLIVINSSGTLLYSYSYTTPISIDHLAYINGDPNHIMVWWYMNNSNEIGRFGRLELATGIIDQDFTAPMFSSGQNQIGTEKFGPTNSCTFVRLTVASTLAQGGIYYINPVKTARHDSYYPDVEFKIPNPTIKTGIVGE